MVDNRDLKKDPPEKEIKYILESLNLKKFSEGKKEIDKKNILQATLIAMERAYKSLNINAEFVIVDGINIPKINTKVKAIKNGDNKSISIASASIIAKVLRDKLMEKLSNKYPRFFWEQNSGYGTKKHIENIKIFGITPHHRKSFKPILKMIK